MRRQRDGGSQDRRAPAFRCRLASTVRSSVVCVVVCRSRGLEGMVSVASPLHLRIFFCGCAVVFFALSIFRVCKFHAAPGPRTARYRLPYGTVSTRRKTVNQKSFDTFPYQSRIGASHILVSFGLVITNTKSKAQCLGPLSTHTGLRPRLATPSSLLRSSFCEAMGVYAPSGYPIAVTYSHRNSHLFVCCNRYTPLYV